VFAPSSSTRAERTVRSSHDADLGPRDAVQAMTLRIPSLLGSETMQLMPRMTPSERLPLIATAMCRV
jgi:hypothetical protein